MPNPPISAVRGNLIETGGSFDQPKRTVSYHCCWSTAEQQRQAVAFAVSGQRKSTNSLGFVPRSHLEEYAATGQLGIVSNNDDWVGFVVHGCTPPKLRIWQAWVRPDARWLYHGSVLITGVCTYARKIGAMRLCLRCSMDLPAVYFWTALGFSIKTHDWPYNARGRLIGIFERERDWRPEKSPDWRSDHRDTGVTLASAELSYWRSDNRGTGGSG